MRGTVVVLPTVSCTSVVYVVVRVIKYSITNGVEAGHASELLLVGELGEP